MVKRGICITLCVVTFFAFGISFFSSYNILGIKANSDLLSNQPIIIIDAGHGGFDGGAVAKDGTVEKNINLNISLKLEQFCKLLGYKTVMIRTDDSSVSGNSNKSNTKVNDMYNRLEYMSKYNNGIFVSIHVNKFESSTAKGAQVFYSPNIEGADILAKSVQSSIVSNLQNGNKRVIKKATKNIFLLYNAKVPAIIAECGFLSNDEDLTNLKNDEYCNKLAFSIALGIQKYYNS